MKCFNRKPNPQNFLPLISDFLFPQTTPSGEIAIHPSFAQELFVHPAKTIVMKLNLPILFSILFILASCTDRGATDSVFDDKVQSDGEGLERIVQKLVPAPNVPEHTQVADGGPKIVEVTLEAIEKKIEVAEGDSVWAMTFNGTVPGPLIVVHEGDFVELTLKNPPTNTQLHNIDFHAATGEGGCSVVSSNYVVVSIVSCHR